MRLIDADALVELLFDYAITDEQREFSKKVKFAVDKQQTVKLETKRGKWVYDRPHHWRCSECESMWGEGHKTMNYCPVCGAEMEAEEDNT